MGASLAHHQKANRLVKASNNQQYTNSNQRTGHSDRANPASLVSLLNRAVLHIAEPADILAA